MDNIEKLRQFKKLLDEGLITEEEYDFKKNEILGQLESKADTVANVIPEPAVVEEAAAEVIDAAPEAAEAAPEVVEEVAEAAPEAVQESSEAAAAEIPAAEEVTDVSVSDGIDDSFVISDMNKAVNEIPPVSTYMEPAGTPGQGQIPGTPGRDPAAAAAAAAMAAGTPVPPVKKKSKTGLIIGIVAAVLLLAAGGFFLTRPKVESISAVYNGSTEIGHTVTADDVTVTANYENGDTKEVTGEVEEYVIHAGNNDIRVSYGDLSTYVSVMSPLMVDGEYVASVDDIKDAVSSYASSNVSGFTGFTLNPEVGGSYDVDGVTGQDMSVSFTKQENGENIAVEGSEVPDTVIVTSIMSADAFGDEVADYIKMGASIYASIDPSVTFESAFGTLKDLMSTALENATGSIGSYSTVIGNVRIYTTVLLANNKVLLVYSFQEP